MDGVGLRHGRGVDGYGGTSLLSQKFPSLAGFDEFTTAKSEGRTFTLLMYKTSALRALGAPGLDGYEGQILRRAGASDGLPFILGPDGSYDLELNRFVRELDSWGVRSEHTREAYARDLMLFGRFLHEHRGGRSIWDAGQEDLRAYKRARRRTEGFVVSASTWNRFIAALDKWVKWALHEELIEARPFRVVEKTVLTPRGLVRVLVNAEREVEDEAGSVRFLAYEDYLVCEVHPRQWTPS